MVCPILVFCLGVLLIIETVLLVRAASKLLQFDEMLESVASVLDEYAIYLKKLSSGDVLYDHPEVARFHNRNLTTIREIDDIVNRIGKGRPAKRLDGPLPRPDVE